MKPKEFCAVDRDRILDTLPPGHPFAEENRLTMFQQQALPTLLWFFDQQRNRATGRSHLMAYVLIELAMRGQRVVLEDLSLAPENRHSYRTNRRFAETVLEVTYREFQGHLFDYDHGRNTLQYRGRKPYGESNRNV
jgi:hypothetical protein